MKAERLLIAEVHKQHALWNKLHPFYKDRDIVDRSWDAVAEGTGHSKEEVKKKWRNMRDQFLKEFKKMPKIESGTDEDYAERYNGKWQYFADLLFLKDAVVPRNSDSNYVLDVSANTPVTKSEYTEYEDEDLNEDFDNQEINFCEVQTPTSPQSVEATHSLLKASRKRKRRRDQIAEIENMLMDFEAKRLNLAQNQEDENLLFLRSLLPYMKNLKPEQQLRVRCKFQEALLQEVSHTYSNPGHVNSSSSLPNNLHSEP